VSERAKAQHKNATCSGTQNGPLERWGPSPGAGVRFTKPPANQFFNFLWSCKSWDLKHRLLSRTMPRAVTTLCILPPGVGLGKTIRWGLYESTGRIGGETLKQKDHRMQPEEKTRIAFEKQGKGEGADVRDGDR